MTNKTKPGLLAYIIGDFIAALVAWILFIWYQQQGTLSPFDLDFLFQKKVLLGLLFVPLSWLFFYHIFDKYKNIYRYSRLSVLGKTLLLSFFGVLILFFGMIVKEPVADATKYFWTFVLLFFLHFFCTAFVRMIILTRASRRLKAGKVAFRTLMIGGNQNALDLYNEINSYKRKLGNDFVGFVDTNGASTHEISTVLSRLGSIQNLSDIIQSQQIEEVIIAIETSEHQKLNSILNDLSDFEDQILIKIIPDMYDILLGSVRMNHVFGAILIEIQPDYMPLWQSLIKRLADIFVSMIGLLVLSPLLLFVAVRVRMSSQGSILFRQERIGFKGKPFYMLKFRSMALDAEKDGPQLSHEHDPRITPWGKVMRKWRFDELPQLWNVLVGEMSIVGPRPERQYYIDKIMEQAPHYKHLLKVRPGITSWGQVKYGYASDVDQMVKRLRFDILYIENMSLGLDLKILLYTIKVLLEGRGV